MLVMAIQTKKVFMGSLGMIIAFMTGQTQIIMVADRLIAPIASIPSGNFLCNHPILQRMADITRNLIFHLGVRAFLPLMLNIQKLCIRSLSNNRRGRRGSRALRQWGRTINLIPATPRNNNKENSRKDDSHHILILHFEYLVPFRNLRILPLSSQSKPSK